MVRRLFAVLALAVVPFMVIPTALAPAASAAPPPPVQACLNGGWKTLTNVSGQSFANEGLCIKDAIQHPVSLADLASSTPFSGSTGFELDVNGCAPIFQGFEATYPGSTNVGSVNLALEGCVNGVGVGGGIIVFSVGPATFTISTNVGTLTGTASGSAIESVGVSYQLTLTVTSGTGFFTGTTGTLHGDFEWPGGDSFSGTITA